MKKIIYILLTCSIFLSACSAKENTKKPKTQPETEETSVSSSQEVSTVTTTLPAVTTEKPVREREISFILGRDISNSGVELDENSVPEMKAEIITSYSQLQNNTAYTQFQIGEMYNADFFDESSLIFYSENFESYTENYPLVYSVTAKSDTVYIKAIREAADDDVVQPWFGFLEVPNSSVKNIKNVEVLIEPPYSLENRITTAKTENYPEYTGEIDVIDAEGNTIYEYFDVPKTFPDACLVDVLDPFRNAYVLNFNSFPGFFTDEFAEYLGVPELSLPIEYYNKYSKRNCLGMKNDTLEVTINLYTFFRDYGIPKDVMLNMLTEYNDMNISFAERFDDETFLDRNYTEEQVEAIVNLDKDLINELFVSDYCIVKGRSIYTPEWLYCHSLEDYVIAGITPEDVKEKLSYFYEFPYDDEAAVFFGDKLSEFTGEDVVFKKWSEWVAES